MSDSPAVRSWRSTATVSTGCSGRQRKLLWHTGDLRRRWSSSNSRSYQHGGSRPGGQATGRSCTGSESAKVQLTSTNDPAAPWAANTYLYMETVGCAVLSALGRGPASRKNTVHSRPTFGGPPPSCPHAGLCGSNLATLLVWAPRKRASPRERGSPRMVPSLQLARPFEKMS